MQIISHRGFWKSKNEQNTIISFQRSFENGFGIETDIRDLNGKLVISHDIPQNSSELIYLTDVLDLAKSYSNDSALTIALNIKADGLVRLLDYDLKLKNIKGLNIFVFDMSVPDMRDYFKNELIVYTRLSEVELSPSYYEVSSGIWLDSFETNWFDSKLIEKHINNGKKICIVSSELHGREKSDLWDIIYPLRGEENLMLCTDQPNEAKVFFNLE